MDPGVPNADGVAAAAGAPNAGVLLAPKLPKPGVLAGAPKAGVLEAPNAGELAGDAPKVPNAGVLAAGAPNAG